MSINKYTVEVSLIANRLLQTEEVINMENYGDSCEMVVTDDSPETVLENTA